MKLLKQKKSDKLRACQTLYLISVVIILLHDRDKSHRGYQSQ